MADVGKHTPGPWTVDGPAENQIVWSTPENRVCSLAHSNGDHPERDFANGRLISAAPDLLAELDVRVGDLWMLLKAIEAGDPKAELLIRVEDMLRETKAAIAKAEGRS